MMEQIPAAIVQLNSTVDKKHNLERATQLIEQAARDGARLVALPELFNCLGPFPQILAAAETIPGETSRLMSQLARRFTLTICAGTVCEQSSQPNRAYNTSLVFDHDGHLIASYRKIHLFQVEIPDKKLQICEADHMLPGGRVVVAESSLGRLGQATCYDLRFPELFRRLVDHDAEIMLLPSAFTKVTGAMHWNVLVRARAIENQCFLVAPNQVGTHAENLISYGHSLIVDPWGIVLAEANGETEQIIHATLDRQRLKEVRARIPALIHRRTSKSEFAAQANDKT